jgi:hypothetical protein
MRRILLKSSIVIACAIAAVIAWVAGARSLSMLLDRLHTVEIDSRPIAQLGIEDANRGMLRVNDFPMSTAMPNYSPYPMEMKVDADQRFVIQSANHAIALGRVEDSLGGGPGLGIKPEPGDKAHSDERSMLLADTTGYQFAVGHSPSWKRHLYYRLVWEKSGGGRLEMVWAEHILRDWASGFLTGRTTGLIRVDIRP